MENCPTFNITKTLGKKWILILIDEISLNGKIGFNELMQKTKKITPKVLSNRLRELEKHQVINKDTINTKYSLTLKGREIKNIINSIKTLNSKYHNTPNCANKECIACEHFCK